MISGVLSKMTAKISQIVRLRFLALNHVVRLQLSEKIKEKKAMKRC